MSFFNGIDMPQDGNFEIKSEDLPLIPKGTKVLASCESAKHDEYSGERYISLMWRVHQPAEYANRVIYQKLKVYTEKSAANHKRMLAAIATNAGNKLFGMMQAQKEIEPSDMTLQACLTNQPMVLQLEVWEMENQQGEKRSGNWVQAVSKRQGQQSAPAPTPAPATDNFGGFEADTIPF